ncbi:flagellin [Acetobacterium sp. K1/6]|uniref:flagellin N-terminal helical domain-containing protein n=1 Tax=Acetobacterium sp. K1/6 TaxID=3055467 RepID=UPI002AC9FDDC|nr:flagellin [Acetobacterium sp. K1/6]MDZ5724893.1 flagellin [Acetobacterium sp. K1/6]
MRINHNIAALNTYNKLSANNAATSKSLEKLSSGLKINRAGDNAAGLAISEKMRGQISGLNTASTNASDGISLIQTAEGALSETHSILQRMRELAVQSSNDTNTSTDRGEMQKEIDQLTTEIDRIANTTEFNTQKLLDGSKEGLRAAANGDVKMSANTSATTVALGAGLASIEGVAASSGSAIKDFTVTITKTADTGTTAGFSVDSPVHSGASLASVTAGGSATLDLSTNLVSASAGTLVITDLDKMKVGDSITLTFKKADAGNNDVSKAVNMQIGANTGQNMYVGIDDMRADALGIRDVNGDAVNIETAGKASAAVTTIDNAIEKVSAQRSQLGAFQNRLEHTINNLGTSSENLTSSESRIRDVDMAKEMMEFTKNNILSQAAQSMLAQANQQPQSVLQLLQ